MSLIALVILLSESATNARLMIVVIRQSGFNWPDWRLFYGLLMTVIYLSLSKPANVAALTMIAPSPWSIASVLFPDFW